VSQSKALVKGKGANIPLAIPAALRSTTFATVQLRSSDGICLPVWVDDIKVQQRTMDIAALAQLLHETAVGSTCEVRRGEDLYPPIQSSNIGP
jgi:hypothetical protein